MARITLDNATCKECSHYHFIEQEVVKINKIALSYKNPRTPSQPLSSTLVEKEIVYVCQKCGTVLDI